MIKKLRKRFMLVIVLIFTSIILAIACGIFVMMLHSEEKESKSIMNFAMISYRNANSPMDSAKPNSDNSTNPPPDNIDAKKHTDGFFNDILANENNPNSMFRSWISADISSDGSIKKLFRSMNRENEDSNALASTQDDSSTELIKSAITELYNGSSDSGSVTVDGITYRYLVNRQENSACARIILLDRSVEIATLQRLGIAIGIIALGGIIIVLVLSIFLSRWAVKPIEEAWKQQKEFIANASHELKTPLTVISANTDVIMSNPDDTISSQKKWFDYIKDEIEKMSKLVGSMLYLAKEDRDEEKIIMTEFDCSEVIEGACLVLDALAYEKGKTLETDIEPDVKCIGDKERINQLAHILIDNAVSHSAEKGYIKVSLHRHKNKVKLIVENNGAQILPDDIPHLFERFYRTDKSRNANTGGFGLGLSIAKMIMDKHNGTISVSSSEDGITKFTAIW